MLTSYRFALAAAVALGFVSGAALAAGDLSKQTPVEITVDLGSPGKHEFSPNKLRFETGKLYKLVLRNASNDPHYFTSHGFSQMIWTRKVQVTAEPRQQDDHARRVQGRDTRGRGLSGTIREWWFVRSPRAASPICAAGSPRATEEPTPITA